MGEVDGGDDLEHGKRTGIAVGYVDRGSDDFEPFDLVIRQADLKTPPKPKVQGRKRLTQRTPVVDVYDEDGEMSMDLEDSKLWIMRAHIRTKHLID